MFSKPYWVTSLILLGACSLPLMVGKAAFTPDHPMWSFVNWLWVFPVIWASHREGLSGGLTMAFIGAVLIGALSLAHHWPADPDWWVELPYMALYVTMALFMGWVLPQMSQTRWTRRPQETLSKSSEEDIQRDRLTQVYNRRFMEESLWKFWDWSQGEGRYFSLLLIDLHHFRQVNGRYGTLVGDRVLRSTVATILNSTRQTDVVGRFGGDQFLVILPMCKSLAAQKLAQRLHGEMAKLTFSDRERPFKVQFAIGLAHYEGDAQDLPNLLRKLSASLNQAKAQKRQGVLAS